MHAKSKYIEKAIQNYTKKKKKKLSGKFELLPGSSEKYLEVGRKLSWVFSELSREPNSRYNYLPLGLTVTVRPRWTFWGLLVVVVCWAVGSVKVMR